MKTLKVGTINFFITGDFDSGIYRATKMCDNMNKISDLYKFEYHDCLKEECDIVFYTLYDKIENLEHVKGKPLFIYWTDEYSCIGANEIWENPFEFYKNNNPSISFYDDSETNCFYPFGMVLYDGYSYAKTLFYNTNVKDRNKFCTFCASNENIYNAQYRTSIVKYISENYKQITCCGSVLNNTNDEYLPWDTEGRVEYHRYYKFNLCFENEYTSGNCMYFTEKLINAFCSNVIPVYWGAERITEFINPESFINCNGLTKEEILQKIIEVDTNDELFEYMMNQYPFKERIDYDIYFAEKLYKFILKFL